MTSRRIGWALLLVIALIAAGCASRAGRHFRLDWELSREDGGPSVRGHLLNRHAVPARQIRLLVEGLDEAGKVVTTTVGYLPSQVLSGSRMAFQVPVPGTAASYRVTVLSYELLLPLPSPGRSR